MSVRCYKHSWYKYPIRTVVYILICEIYVIESWTEGWSELHMGWIKTYVSRTQERSYSHMGWTKAHLSRTQDGPKQKIWGTPYLL